MRVQTFDVQMELNRAAYEQLSEEIRRAGSGHYAAIAEGRLVAITDDFHAAVSAVESLVPAPEHYLVFPTDSKPVFEVVDSLGGEIQ